MFGNDDPFGNAMFQTGETPKQSQPAQKSSPQFQQNTTPGEQTNKYQILNMFWLVNQKVYSKDSTWLQNEVPFITISYNINFGNLRFEVCNMSDDSIINGHIIALNKVQKIASGTVYPTAMFELVSNQLPVDCLEQIVNSNSGDWVQNLKPVKFAAGENDSIVMSIGQHCFEFSGTQKEILLYCCKFSLNQGFNLSGENIINRR